MKKLKLMTVLGTRPEIIRLSEVIKENDKHFDQILVHTGQNWDYTLNEIFFKDLELRKPDYYLNSVGEDLGETLGNIISESYKVMVKEKPDALLVLGDTNSSLSAISAKRLKIPIFHMEAGNRCWDWNVPEMINRKIVDHIADINLPYTENSRQYLLSEGIDGKTVFVTGSPMAEVIHQHQKKIKNSNILEKLKLEKSKYLVLSAHREENIDNEDNFIELMSSINEIAEDENIKIIYSMHPRSKNMINKRNFKFHENVIPLEPLGFIDYIKLQQNALCVLSDSGTLSEESAMLNFPGVLIRTSTERPEALDSGTIIIGGITSKDVINSMNMAIRMHKEHGNLPINKDYESLDVSGKVAKIIQSYTHIVNKTTWNI